jgi:FixJ family two-component response regulator
MATSDKKDRERRAQETKSLIAIIDDDESIREAIGGLMRWLGLRVGSFSSAVEFLASPDLAENSCIIADVHMPQMTGIELHTRLKALGYRIPTILITAYPNDETRARALADGVVCYLVKPFDNATLMGCVQSALQTPSE